MLREKLKHSVETTADFDHYAECELCNISESLDPRKDLFGGRVVHRAGKPDQCDRKRLGPGPVAPGRAPLRVAACPVHAKGTPKVKGNFSRRLKYSKRLWRK